MPGTGHWIENCFRPSAEITEPRFFAGRVRELRELVRFLHRDGACPIIYGDRGLGKSSLAHQGDLIAKGQVELLHDYGLAEYSLSEDDAFATEFVRCDKGVTDVVSLIAILNDRLMTRIDHLNKNRSDDLSLVERATSLKVNMGYAVAERASKYATRPETNSSEQLRVEQQFRQLVDEFVELTGQRLLIVIDELDLVEDRTGLGGFLKYVSADHLKLVLVGVANNVAELIRDHRSVERIICPIEVSLMPAPELRQIIDRAERYLAEHGVTAYFSREARALLLHDAGGYPWFVHILGQEALTIARQDQRDSGIIVSADDVQQARAVLSRRFTEQHSDIYHRAVGSSRQREMVLKVLANYGHIDIPISTVYTALRTHFKIRDPAEHKNKLMQEVCGRILIRSPGESRTHVRFASGNFKQFAKLRPPIHDEIVRPLHDGLAEAHLPGYEPPEMTIRKIRLLRQEDEGLFKPGGRLERLRPGRDLGPPPSRTPE